MHWTQNFYFAPKAGKAFCNMLKVIKIGLADVYARHNKHSTRFARLIIIHNATVIFYPKDSDMAKTKQVRVVKKSEIH